MQELAIHGGKKTRTRPFPNKKDVGIEELKEVAEVIWSGQLNRVGGTKVSNFEKEFAKLYGVEYAVASTSGTASIHVALGALNLDPGSEVITGPISDMGSIIPILYQGLIPIFVDIDPKTYALDPEDVERKISEKTKAIMAIHLFGLADKLDELRKIAKEHNLYLIEDTSQAHLAEYKDKLAGTIGDIGCFSLQQSKQMTTGDGGMTIFKDKELYERGSLFADKAWPRSGKLADRGYLFLAMNYRMTELQGAVGLAQVKKIRNIVERRRKVGEKLVKMIKEEVEGVIPPHVPSYCKHSFWLFPITLDEEKIKIAPEVFNEALNAEGIPSSFGYIKKPLYLYPVLKEKITFGRSHYPFDLPEARKVEYKEGDCPNAEKLLKKVITIPVNEFYEDEDIEDIIKALKKVSNYYIKNKLNNLS
jgi:dTDP-4-amino-4,6-dideoxygalactose transaminase